MYHWREIQYERFGGRPSVGGRPVPLLNPALGVKVRKRSIIVTEQKPLVEAKLASVQTHTALLIFWRHLATE